MTTTLVDVHTAIADGHYREAAQQLQEVLQSSPSADAWFLAAQFTMEKDRDRAVRHLKRALLLNPRHGDSLTLLGQLGEGREFTVSDVADEFGDVVAEQVDQTPIIGKLKRPQQIIFVVILSLVVILSFTWAVRILFPHVGPAYIPEQAPEAQQVVLLDANQVINHFARANFEIFAVQYVSSAQTPGKRVMRFAVPGRDGRLKPAQIIVYDSISDLVRDHAAQEQWEEIYSIAASGNTLLLYSHELEGLIIERKLLNHFNVITGA
jgi:hypothetical protein